jgi:hypothetical protein
MVWTQLAGKVLVTQQLPLCHTSRLYIQPDDHPMLPQRLSQSPTACGDHGIGCAPMAKL